MDEKATCQDAEVEDDAFRDVFRGVTRLRGAKRVLYLEARRSAARWRRLSRSDFSAAYAGKVAIQTVERVE
jgi:hypothetical protein